MQTRQSHLASADKLYSSVNPVSFLQELSFNKLSSGNQHDVLGLNNDFGASFTTDPMNSHLQSDNVATFASQTHGQLVAETQQPSCAVPSTVAPEPILGSKAVAGSPHSSISLETSQHIPPTSATRAITPAGGLHICRNHHKLVQSCAEYKYVYLPPSSTSCHISHPPNNSAPCTSNQDRPSVSFIYFSPPNCVFCAESQSTSPQSTPNAGPRPVPRLPNPCTNKSARPSIHSFHQQGIFYCSFQDCNRGVNGDEPFNRNDNKNEHEHRVHGIPRRKRTRAVEECED